MLRCPLLMSLSVHTVQISSMKPLGQSKTNFVWKHHLKVGTKVCLNNPRHMAKKTATTKNVNTLNNLLKNQKSKDLETWHAELGTQALRTLYK